MKNLAILVLLLIAVQSSFAQAGHHQNGKVNGAAKSETYTCPMHPEVKSSEPGKCPKCGMTLVKEKPVEKTGDEKHDMEGKEKFSKEKEQPQTYICPMHPEIKSSEPGKCPKCRMDLVKSEPEMNSGMQMTGLEEIMETFKVSKENLGPIKTISASAPPRTVRYDLYVRDTIVNFGNKPIRAIAVNGQIPMPTLTFTEGDTAVIYVHNRLKEKTSMHWHGLFLPNKEDGVPYLTQMPIEPGETYVYQFPIIQHGTHWYHSHSGLQEQIGMYGAFIMNRREEWDIPTIPLVISEWTDMNPKEVHRSLKNGTDWFGIQKSSTQSYLEAIKQGHFKTKVTNEWKRMSAMDVSDIYYDTFLINGKNQNEQSQFKAGDKVRLRIANAGASSYFWLNYAGGKMTVLASDGNDVEPVEVDRLLIAVSETFDVVVTIPEDKSYEFLVTPEDRTKSASLWLGNGEKVFAGEMPKLKYFAGMKMMNSMMDMQGNMIEMEGMKMQNQEMDMNIVMYPEINGDDGTSVKMDMDHGMPGNKIEGHDIRDMENEIVTLNYNMLRALQETTLPEGPVRTLEFELTGNMDRYVWTMDNKTISESDKILIKKGEILRVIMFNNSMMRHPMHLHGHDFRVINDHGAYAPMKNVIDIMPMERDTIEFKASESGDWFFHCHILYHMMAGMGRVFSYENSPSNPTIPDPKYARRKLFSEDRKSHVMANIGLESNGSDGEIMISNTRFRLNTEWRIGLNKHHGIESETYFGRYIGRMQWFFPFVGFDYHYNSVENQSEKNLFDQVSNQDNRKVATAGFQYTLPMLVLAEVRVDSEGKFRVQLMREDIALTPRLRMVLMGNTDWEYMSGLRYILTKYFSLSTHYDSDMGYGAGITLTY